MEEPGSKSWDTGEDMMQKLDEDTVIHVLEFLDTPSDLAHAACVSRSWRRYVSEGSLWRELCIKCFPEVRKFERIIEVGSECSPSLDGSSQSTSVQFKLEEGNHVYNHFMYELRAPPIEKSCIIEPLYASSTDNFPRESIAQTLFPRPRYPDGETPSYWSSKGQSNTDVPETLTYLLVSNLCVVHEVKIQPFLAYFQQDDPIYSAKSVRFRFGYSRSPRPYWSGLDSLYEPPESVNDDDYFWTYESPEFLMAQEDTLQTFKLPRPVLCVGGIFQIELMGRVQTQQQDGLYYICVSHVNVYGSPLLDFEFEPLVDREDKYLLKYSRKIGDNAPTARNYPSSSLEENTAAGSPGWLSLAERIRQIRTNRLAQWNRSLFDMLLGNLAVTGLLVGIDEDSDDDGDEEILE